MAYVNFIPKIEYKKAFVTGDLLISTNTILNIADTSNLELGMFVEHANLPEGATIATINASDIIVSENAIGTQAAATLSTGHRISFRNPPQGDFLNEDLKFDGKTKTSRSGRQQTLTNFIEEKLTIKFFLMSQSERDIFKAWLIAWAYPGKSFSYFIDKDEVTDERIVNVLPQGKSTKFKIQFRKSSGYDFRYSWNLKVRSVVG